VTPEREAIERGWYYLRTDAGLERRAHGYPARLIVEGFGSRAALVQAASRAAREGADGVLVTPEGTRPLTLQEPGFGPPVDKVLFFESLMNSDMPHNDREISQGVLHMAAPLRGTATQVVLANVKMRITGDERPVQGLDALEASLPGVGLICITLLEGYWEGVVELIAAIRQAGSRAHIAVGGVMPTLAPEHVAAHLDGASFICRGAGEIFVPQLANIVSDSDIDTPFTEAQRAALIAMEGLLAFDPGGALIAARPDRVVTVEDLSRVELDLAHVHARHVQDGIEIATSRGCIHKCTFCSILGRESYQARSAESVVELLGRYEQHFSELFGDDVPRQAFRVHFSDDDFACDKERAIALFRGVLDTPFRLASVQVSIADLCRKEQGRTLPEPDPELFDALDPRCFDDHGRSFPESDFVADHKSRRWSSYLQIGVEAFSDAELVRLGKGYKRAHVRIIAAELAQRGLHWDAYVILSNADTSAQDLVDSVTEIARLKLRFPVHFHARFPVVPHLVSYFTAASHRRLVRQGRVDRLRIRETLHHDDAPELDYPLVDHDLPEDDRVAEAVEAELFTDEGYYTQTLLNLRSQWTHRKDLESERLVRALDDAPRRLMLEALEDARRNRGSDWPGWEPDTKRLVAMAEKLVGPDWKAKAKRWSEQSVPRLVLIPTWQCELRCRYCFIPKQDGRVMSAETVDRSVELLLSSARDEVMLQFFGGEALLEWELVKRAISRTSERAAALGKRVRIVLSSNGWSLDAEKLAWLKQHPVKLELSLDGRPELQNRFRRALLKGGDSYQMGIAPRVEDIVAAGVPYDVIMVVHPDNADRVAESFQHIAELGFERIQINHALGYRWTKEQMTTFAAGLHRIGQSLPGRSTVLVNAEQPPMPVRLNAEITVDWDGTVYGGNGFLHETEHKERFRLGHLDDGHGFDRYWLDAPDNDFLLRWSYPEDVTANNLAVGRIMTSFVRWLRAV